MPRQDTKKLLEIPLVGTAGNRVGPVPHLVAILYQVYLYCHVAMSHSGLQKMVLAAANPGAQTKIENISNRT